jgi:hypothetical protein
MLQLRAKFAPIFSLIGISFVVMIFCGTSGAAALLQGGEADSGVFVILADQKKIGTEKFKITESADGIEATAQIEVEAPGAPKITETASLKIGKNRMPISYIRQQTAPKKGTLTVDFGTPESKLSSKTSEGSDDRLFYLPSERLAVLDTNLFHQYAVLIREYDITQGGAQLFNVFVPQEATPGTLRLEFLGNEQQTIGKASRDMGHFQITTDEVKMDLWATPKGELYKISIAQAKLEVVRQ